MTQQKFISLEAVLNYIPSSIREADEDVNLMQLAFQGLRQYLHIDNAQQKFEMCVVPIYEHKAKLPDGVLKIAQVRFCDVNPMNGSFVDRYRQQIEKYVNWMDETDNRLIVAQSPFYPVVRDYFQKMRYSGQDTDLLIKGCYDLSYQCDISYSIARNMRLISSSQRCGFLCVLYRTYIRNNTGNLLIPDNAELHQAMAYFAQAQHWLNRTGRKEQGALPMFQQLLQLAEAGFVKARSTNILRSFDINAYRHLVMGRFNMQRLPEISGNGRNQNHQL